MKTIRLSIISLLAVLGFASCQKSDSEMDLGMAYVYIPQATVTGLDNSYPVPNGSLSQNTKYVCKFDKESGVLSINVGVVRSGFMKNAKGFTVELKECVAQTQSKLDSYAASSVPAMALPTDVCTVPSTITVNDGDNSGTCYVTVNMKALQKKQASIYVDDSYKILVLGLEISNPSRYELASSNTSVVICLDLNSDEWDKANSPVRTLFPII